MNRLEFIKNMCGAMVSLSLFPQMLKKSPEDIFEKRLKNGEIIKNEKFTFTRTINCDTDKPAKVLNCKFIFTKNPERKHAILISSKTKLADFSYNTIVLN